MGMIDIDWRLDRERIIPYLVCAYDILEIHVIIIIIVVVLQYQ